MNPIKSVALSLIAVPAIIFGANAPLEAVAPKEAVPTSNGVLRF